MAKRTPAPAPAPVARPAPRPKAASFSVPSWPAWVQMILACFAGTVMGGFVASNIAVSKSEEAILREAETRAMDRFIGIGGEVLRDGKAVNELGVPKLKGLGFYTITSQTSLQRAILYGGTLPNITELHFAPFGANRVGAGIADENTLRFANRNFKSIKYLNLANCRVKDLTILQAMPYLQKLNIANNPLSTNALQSLNLLDSVEEIWVGWPDRSLSSDSTYRSKAFRADLIKALASMKNLRKLHVYEMTLAKSEKERLSKFEIVPAYMN